MSRLKFSRVLLSFPHFLADSERVEVPRQFFVEFNAISNNFSKSQYTTAYASKIKTSQLQRYALYIMQENSLFGIPRASVIPQFPSPIEIKKPLKEKNQSFQMIETSRSMLRQQLLNDNRVDPLIKKHNAKLRRPK